MGPSARTLYGGGTTRTLAGSVLSDRIDYTRTRDIRELNLQQLGIPASIIGKDVLGTRFGSDDFVF
jgi:hypothetical protein